MKDPQNYFEIFGLEPDFQMDEKLLEGNYRSLQALLHPDRHVNGGAREKRLAAAKSSLVNEAYHVLSDTCSRAAYLLETRGLELDAEKDTTADADFLFEQMELEESLQQLDGRPSLDDANRLLDKIRSRADGAQAGFERAWRAHDLDAAREWVLKMKFLHKVQQKAVRLVQRLEVKGGAAATG